MDGEGTDYGAMSVRTDAAGRSLVPLILCVGFLVLGWSLEATPESARLLGVEGPQCPSTWLPEGWWLREAGCPGCGMTRATGLAFHGRWAESWNLHPAAGLVIFLAALGALLHLSILLTGRRGPFQDRSLRYGRVLFALGILGAWILRI